MLKQHRQGRARRLIGGAAVTALSLGVGLAVWAAQPARVVQARPRVTILATTPRTYRASPLYKAVAWTAATGPVRVIADGADVDFEAQWRRHAPDRGRAHRAEPTGRPVAGQRRRSEPGGARRRRAADRRRRRIGCRADIAKGPGRARRARSTSSCPATPTPLINAIRSGDLATVRYLVDKGAEREPAGPRRRLAADRGGPFGPRRGGRPAAGQGRRRRPGGARRRRPADRGGGRGTAGPRQDPGRARRLGGVLRARRRDPADQRRPVRRPGERGAISSTRAPM
jgi:hypothetical protein